MFKEIYNKRKKTMSLYNSNVILYSLSINSKWCKKNRIIYLPNMWYNENRISNSNNTGLYNIIVNISSQLQQENE